MISNNSTTKTTTTNETSSSSSSSSYRRSSSIRYHDVSNTMNRMRSSLLGSSDQTNHQDCHPRDTRQQPQQQQEPQPKYLYTNDSNKQHIIQQQNQQKETIYQQVIYSFQSIIRQVPSIILIGLFHLMIGIPFGVSYFPIEWTNNESSLLSNDDDSSRDSIHGGRFPDIPGGKEILGIRMFLFSTLIGQIVFTLQSGFQNPIGLQMVENVPFNHALAYHVIRRQGYGLEALSTLFFLFGLSSILVGVVFWILGHFNLGSIVYYIPNHVLVGCIAGIGIFLIKTGVEVTINAVFWEAWKYKNLVGIVIALEIILRIIDFLLRDKNGKPKYALLSPIYFCLITPILYLGLCILGISIQDATDAGYFFPSLQQVGEVAGHDSKSVLSTLTTMWRIIDVRLISIPAAIMDSISTIVALTLFSLIHVPINIPAFSVTTNVEVDMDNELISHGYSNLLSGILGGLPNYMAYTQSVIYHKSGGTGRLSGMAVAFLTMIIFVIGPSIASYIPRCMAGTLLLHVGLDLFLEGVLDSYSKFDTLEYAGVLLIILVMTLYGMDAAMIAGFLSALFTFVAQNMTYIDPIRGTMSAATLRSDKRNRHHEARALLEDLNIGRSRIMVIQFQGHLFFGNIGNVTNRISNLLSSKFETGGQPIIIIIDFSLVLGIDSSAAQAITKLKTLIHKQYQVELSVFVTGSEHGFPCAFDLSKELMEKVHNECLVVDETSCLMEISQNATSSDAAHTNCHISEDLNAALIHAENYLIARHNPELLVESLPPNKNKALCLQPNSTLEEEYKVAIFFLMNLTSADQALVQCLFTNYVREQYVKGDVLWKQGDASSSVKLVVRGMLMSTLEMEAGTVESVSIGTSIGELGFIEGSPRMSTITCWSDDAIVYSMWRESYDQLLIHHPHSARLLDIICIRYLSARVQHVSNRIFETRCLPI